LLVPLERGSLPLVDFIVANIPKPLSMACGWENGIAHATPQLSYIEVPGRELEIKI